jgi:hypothetical protein
LKNVAVTNNPPSSPFTKGGILTPPFGRLFPARGRQGRSGGILINGLLKNSKGISVLFLIIALLLMMTIGYVLSYLIPTKQKSVKFPISSNQAFFIAQSGVEYGIRYGADRGWRGTTDSGVYDLSHLNDSGINQRNLGNGRFTVNYSSSTNVLTSTGEITNGTEKRIIRVSNYNYFLRLIFDPASPGPCWSKGTREAPFYIKNVRGDDVTLTAFSSTWIENPPPRRITSIEMNGAQKYSGTYYSGDPNANFNRGGNSQTITPNQVITVVIYWNANLTNPTTLFITFYTAAGEAYIFNLDPEGNGIPSC